MRRKPSFAAQPRSGGTRLPPGYETLSPAVRFEVEVLMLCRDGRLPRDPLQLPASEFRRWRTAMHVLLTVRAFVAAPDPPKPPTRKPR